MPDAPENSAELAAALAVWLEPSPKGGDDLAELAALWLDTPLGGMVAVAGDSHLHLLEFADCAALPTELRHLASRSGQRIGIGRTPMTDRVAAQLAGYFAGHDMVFDLPLAPQGTPFQHRVWQELQAIPVGSTISYAELARRIDKPSAVRAVAAANGANPISIVIPCHRVIGSNGTLTGYGGGLWRKQYLIAHEAGQGAFHGGGAQIRPEKA